MADFNPGSTGTKGLQWSPALAPGVTLDALTKSATMSVLQTAAQVTANEKVYVGAIPTRTGMYAVEVYDDETAVPTGLATTTVRPNEDVSISTWTEDDGTTTTIYTEIDEATLDLADYIKAVNVNYTTVRTYQGRVATAAASLAGKRILAVTLTAYVNITYGLAGLGGGRWRLGLNLGGTLYYSGVIDHSVVAAKYISNTWTVNPSTGKSWTIAEVEALDSTDEYAIEVLAYQNVETFLVYQAYLDVVTVTENRLAVGYLDDTGSLLTANAYNTVPVLTPTGGAWTKDGAGRHLYLVRRVSSVGALVVPTLQAAAVPNPASGFTPTLDPTYGYATAMGSAVPGVFGLVQRTSAPADSVDSQPYSLQVEAPVYSGRVAEQEFSSAAVASYGNVQTALVKPNGATGNLLIKVKRRSDNVQMGTTITWTAAEVALLPDAGGGWKLLERQMGTPVTLATATQYYFEFSDATAADTGSGTLYWSVLTLDVGDATTGVTAGFGGTTDRATINGAEADRYDIPITLGSIPTVPANFTTTLATQTLDVPAVPGGCEVDGIAYVALDWDATSLSASFTRYELQRSDDNQATWDQVLEVTTESVSAWNDYGTRRGVQTCYRLRVVRSDGAVSAWTTVKCVTTNAESCELIFTHPTDPTLNLSYNRPPDITYDFLSSSEAVLQRIYGSDYQAAFLPTEERGVAFKVPLIVNFVATPTDRGVSAFDALRALARAAGPYVCVLDHEGNRFLALLQVPAGDVHQPGERYVGNIVVTEITGVPTVVSIS